MHLSFTYHFHCALFLDALNGNCLLLDISTTVKDNYNNVVLVQEISKENLTQWNRRDSPETDS